MLNAKSITIFLRAIWTFNNILLMLTKSSITEDIMAETMINETHPLMKTIRTGLL